MFGKMYKLFGLKRIFLVSVIIFMLGSILCAAVPTSPAFVVRRPVCGFAGTGLTSRCFYSLVQTLPLRKSPLRGGILSAVEGISVIASPLIGGILVSKPSWRWCFWINLPHGVLTLVTLALFLEDVTPAEFISWREKLSQLDLLATRSSYLRSFVFSWPLVGLALAPPGTLRPSSHYS